jgi:hypothetical protein
MTPRGGDRVDLDHALSGHAPAGVPLEPIDAQTTVDHSVVRHSVVGHVLRDPDEGRVAVYREGAATDAGIHEGALLTEGVGPWLNEGVDLHAAQVEAHARAPTDPRRERRPSHIAAARTPGHPRGRPLVSGNPEPVI